MLPKTVRLRMVNSDFVEDAFRSIEVLELIFLYVSAKYGILETFLPICMSMVL